MAHDAGLDVSRETTSICVVTEDGRVVAERKVASCPDAIAEALRVQAPALVRAGMETGPLAVWLWNELNRRTVPVVCMDARHANAALSIMPNKTDRTDALGLAQIVRTGWFKQVHIKSKESHQLRALLAARRQLVESRCRLENKTRGILRTFGVRFGKKVGGFTRRAAAIMAEELDALPAVRFVIAAQLKTHAELLAQLRSFDTRIRTLVRQHEVCRRFTTDRTAPPFDGVGPIAALAVYTAIDQPARFRRSAAVGAYLGLTPRRYASGKVDRKGRITKRGDEFARVHLFEAANALLTRGKAFSTLKAWGLKLAKVSGFKKAKVAVARKLAVILHAMWKNGSEFRWQATATAA